MIKSPGRPKHKHPAGVSMDKPGQTYNANQAPRRGQRTKSPYQRFLQGQRFKYKQDAPNYAIGRTRRMA